MHNGSKVSLLNIVNEDRKFVYRTFEYRRFVHRNGMNVVHNGSKVSLVNIVS